MSKPINCTYSTTFLLSKTLEACTELLQTLLFDSRNTHKTLNTFLAILIDMDEVIFFTHRLHIEREVLKTSTRTVKYTPTNAMELVNAILVTQSSLSAALKERLDKSNRKNGRTHRQEITVNVKKTIVQLRRYLNNNMSNSYMDREIISSEQVSLLDEFIYLSERHRRVV